MLSPAFDVTLGYATNTLDRLAMRRDDADFLRSLHDDAGSTTVVLVGEQVLLDAGGRPWFALSQGLAHAAVQCSVLLGSEAGHARFAVGLPAEGGEELAQRNGLRLQDLRSIATQGVMPPAEIGALAEAKAILHWHRQHRFCANCGAPTALAAAGWRRECAACGLHHFPRTDPVVIMMAVDGERCLLGRQPRFPPGMYSCLAGFVEPGETLEAAVRRELAEEAGIATGAVTYLGSQPWPFPASIMIGCLARATSTAITIDATELEDARWFSRDETLAILEGRHTGGLVCPPVMAIANHLMRSWATGASTA